MKLTTLLLIILTAALLAGCVAPIPTVETALSPTGSQETPTVPTLTPFLPDPTATQSPKGYKDLVFFTDPAVPEGLRTSLPSSLTTASIPEQADLLLAPQADGEDSVAWIYALVGPFPMLRDEISWQELQERWQAGSQDSAPIMLTEPTYLAVRNLLGEPAAGAVEMVPPDELINRLWGAKTALGIVPFENLDPRFKVLSIDGQSPISNHFDTTSYPLAVQFGWQGQPWALDLLAKALARGEAPQLASNRDPSKLTVMVMTGVTALVRATATRMEQMGMTYPGLDIQEWLVNADLTHISNEVSFTPTCPNPDPNQVALIFCSKPEYIELLDYVGTDILELTGNHDIDWGRDALTYSLDLYHQRGWTIYAAGENLEQARAAATIEHNGNRFAFIGCNPAGPPFIWAAETLSGVANCDYPWMHAEINRLKSEGYIVIATFQYFEAYRAWAESFEIEDFRAMADAGATIVSGSQAHHPMVMELYKDSFIHYGLGNLFFDQMYNETVTIPQGTRKEFIDRHVFYNGKHISTELLTALLEDFSRPRPMSAAERDTFLQEIFDSRGWSTDLPWNYTIE